MLTREPDLARTFDRSGLFGLAEFIARLGDLVEPDEFGADGLTHCGYTAVSGAASRASKARSAEASPPSDSTMVTKSNFISPR